MDDCCAPRGIDGYEREFDDRFAHRLARDYRRNGAPAAARRIVEVATSTGLDGASVLEIGGGIGDIQLELLRHGAAHATNLELSGAYESEALRLLDEAGMRGRATRSVGIDIAATPEAVETSDVVVLHRVVCCYPDYRRLLDAAAQHARRAVVFSHPPRTFVTMAGVGLLNLLYRLRRHPYRAFVHPPDAMIGVLERHGFEPLYRDREGTWCIVGAVRSL
ncbi:methyltransferase domain-containing protein [Microbacterium immunditiarum]|uniref:Magnesium-protoporphyrin O-methyltransferase n=1 Tax=Microbacterium immunditiarum TaxID=337480 RepID=A0A7Y9GMI5_9MICO|nr:methyltransferase domain-containing protein [Microbacterium immunditiarum]NYE19234.1 magnesium-protoporphyrin O-methyltransferase [Microbacterium immunditiarum]